MSNTAAEWMPCFDDWGHATLGHNLYDENLGITASRVRRPILPSR
jgi:hypothetical protein